MEVKCVPEIVLTILCVLARANVLGLPEVKAPCTGQGVQWVRSSSSCSHYIVCGFGQPVATLVCPNGLLWSVAVNNCVPKGSRWDDCSAGKATSTTTTAATTTTASVSFTAAPHGVTVQRHPSNRLLRNLNGSLQHGRRDYDGRGKKGSNETKNSHGNNNSSRSVSYYKPSRTTVPDSSSRTREQHSGTLWRNPFTPRPPLVTKTSTTQTTTTPSEDWRQRRRFDDGFSDRRDTAGESWEVKQGEVPTSTYSYRHSQPDSDFTLPPDSFVTPTPDTAVSSSSSPGVPAWRWVHRPHTRPAYDDVVVDYHMDHTVPPPLDLPEYIESEYYYYEGSDPPQFPRAKAKWLRSTPLPTTDKSRWWSPKPSGRVTHPTDDQEPAGSTARPQGMFDTQTSPWKPRRSGQESQWKPSRLTTRYPWRTWNPSMSQGESPPWSEMEKLPISLTDRPTWAWTESPNRPLTDFPSKSVTQSSTASWEELWTDSSQADAWDDDLAESPSPSGSWTASPQKSQHQQSPPGPARTSAVASYSTTTSRSPFARFETTRYRYYHPSRSTQHQNQSEGTREDADGIRRIQNIRDRNGEDDETGWHNVKVGKDFIESVLNKSSHVDFSRHREANESHVVIGDSGHPQQHYDTDENNDHGEEGEEEEVSSLEEDQTDLGYDETKDLEDQMPSRGSREENEHIGDRPNQDGWNRSDGKGIDNSLEGRLGKPPRWKDAWDRDQLPTSASTPPSSIDSREASWGNWGSMSTASARSGWRQDSVIPWLTPSYFWRPAITTAAPPLTPESTSPALSSTVSMTTAVTAAGTTTPAPPTTPSHLSTSLLPSTRRWVLETLPETEAADLQVTPTIISWTPPPEDHDHGRDDGDDKGRDDSEAETDLGNPGRSSTEDGRKRGLTTSAPEVEDDLAWQIHNDTPHYHPECGVAVTNMIVGGLPASEGRWPWVVSLRLTWARRHVCGGTLVHPQWIVTAAHCVYGSQFEEASEWRAVFGNVQPTLTSDVKHQHKIDLIVRHPEFINGGNYPNDIAMLRLQKAVDVSGFRIRHACLPSRDQPFLADSQCWIMGWGETKGFEEQSQLQQLDVKIRRNQACAARWGWKRILNSHVCVGNGDEGACNGDSGGPLVCLRDGYYFLAGVTSWGVSGCQTTGYPSVFSRVSFYEKWIKDVLDTHSTFHFPLKT